MVHFNFFFLFVLLKCVNVYTVTRGPYKYEHYNLKYTNLIFMNTETQYGNFFQKRPNTFHFSSSIINTPDDTA